MSGPGGEPAGAGAQLAERLRVLRRRWPLVVAITLVVTGVALAVSLTSAKRYDATAKLLLSQSEPIDALITGSAGPSSSDPERDINTDVQLIELDTVARPVIARLGLHISPEGLLREISADVDGTSNVISLTVRDSSPHRAAAIANAYAAQYVAFRRNQARSGIDQAAKLAQSQLAALGAAGRQTPQGRQLAARLRELQIAAALQTGGVDVVRSASVPLGPSRPRPALSGGIGFLAGLLLAIAAAFGLEYADRRIKDEERAQDAFGIEALALIPRPQRRSRGVLGDDPGQREAYGLLAANLRFSVARARSNVFMVTSAGPAEGKTSVTLGLARSLATVGQRVIAIEADLRRPAFARYLGLEPAPGLAALLTGDAPLTDELIWLDARSLRPVSLEHLEDGLTFAVLPAGASPPNPQRLLAQPAMATLLSSVRSLADVVLIDTAPLGSVNDAATLARSVDAGLVVARLGETTKDAARRVTRVLGNVDLEIAGLVLTNSPPVTDDYAYIAPVSERRDAERRTALALAEPPDAER